MNKPFAKSAAELLKERKNKIIGERPTGVQVIDIRLERLKPNPFQPRQDYKPSQIEELARSIETVGLLQPVIVALDPQANEEYYLIAGHRRAEAHRHLKRETIQALVRDWSEQADIQAFIENMQRVDLNPFEAAEALQDIMTRHSWRQKEVAAELGLHKQTVNRLVQIGKLPERIQHEFTETPASIAMLYELTQLKDEALQLKTWNGIKEGRITTRDQVRKLYQPEEKTSTDKEAKPSTTDRKLKDLNKFVHWIETLAADDVILNAERADELMAYYQRISNALSEIQRKLEGLND